MASTAPRRCSCSVSASALISIERRAQRIVGIGGAAANREVVLAQGREQVRQRLQRHDDAVRTEAARPNSVPRMRTVSVHWTFGV